MELINKLLHIQKNLNAPKSQINKFGGYKYRSCEDIQQAVKPFLDGCIILLDDELILIGERYYIKATAKITDGKETIKATGLAREELSKKGMDASQITGSTSSYARKYALNALLLIDDNKDADSQDNKGNDSQYYQVDDNAKAWISAINSGVERLENIEDLNYRNFIKSNLR